MLIHIFHQRFHFTSLPIFHVPALLDVSSPRFPNPSLLTFTFPLREWFRNVRILSPNNAELLPRGWNPQLRYCESSKTHLHHLLLLDMWLWLYCAYGSRHWHFFTRVGKQSKKWKVMKACFSLCCIINKQCRTHQTNFPILRIRKYKIIV